MKRILLPALCAVLLVARDSGGRSAVANAAAGTPAAAEAAKDAPVPAPTPGAPAKDETAPPPVPEVDPVLAKAAVPSKPAPVLPKPVAEVIQLAQTSLGDSVLIHFIEAIQEPFTLNADQIIYLNDIGFDTPVLNALLTKAASGPAVGTPTDVAPAGAPAGIAVAPAPVGAESAAAALAPPSNGLDFPGGPGTDATAPVYGAPVYGEAPAAGTAVTAVAAPAAPVTYDAFYSGLSTYGNWVQDDDYGWCWQPTVVVVNPGWQPYCDGGGWLWSDYGWYWNSTYSWGWAPFHYGRWHRAARHGWVWSPGCDWGPAWVAWRHSDAHCGWAPLPPECHWRAGVGFSWYGPHGTVSIGFGLHNDSWFACPWDRFCSPVLPPHRLDRFEHERFVHSSRQIIAGDRSVNVIGNNNTVVINNGISHDEVQKHSREEIRKVSLRDTTAPASSGLRVAGGSATRPVVPVFRPHLAPEAVQPKAPPATVLTRQEDRKNGIVSSSSGNSLVPSRPSTPGAAGFGSAGTPARSLATTPARPAYVGNGVGEAPTRPAASVGRSIPPPAGVTSARPVAPTQTTPNYISPSRGSTVGVQPNNNPTRTFAPQTATAGVQSNPNIPGQGPSYRYEERKYVPQTPSYGRSVPPGVVSPEAPAVNRSAAPVRPDQGYVTPARGGSSYVSPAARPAPVYQAPVARPESRSYTPAPPPAPAARSYQPAPSQPQSQGRPDAGNRNGGNGRREN